MRLILLTTFLILSGRLLHGQVTPFEKKVQGLWQEGNRYDAKGDYEKAFACYSRVSAMVEQLDSTALYYTEIRTRIVEYIVPLGLKKEAIQRLKEIIGVLERHHPGNTYNRMYLQAMLAGLYSGTQQYDSAFVYMKRNIALARSMDPGSFASQLNNTGMICMEAGKPSEAHGYFSRALESLNGEHRPDWNLLYSVNDNLGELEMARQRFDKALEYFTACYSLLPKLPDWPHRKLQARLQLGRLYAQMNRPADSERELKAAERLLATIAATDRIQYRLKIDDAYCTLYRTTGRYEEAYRTGSRNAVLRDSLAHAESQKREGILGFLVGEQLSEVSTKLQLEQEKSRRRGEELKVSDQRRSFSFTIAFIVAVCSVVVIVAGALYFRIRRRQDVIEAEALKVRNRLADIELKASRLEQEELKNTLAYKQQDISDLALYVTNLRNLHETMLTNLGEIRKMDVAQQLPALKRMMTDIGNRLDLGQKSSLIHENIEEVNQEFYNRLQQKHPFLTKVDWELCGLIRLNMDNKEIAALKSIEPESVKRSKNRLRKKLGLNATDDMQQYLKAI